MVNALLLAAIETYFIIVLFAIPVFSTATKMALQEPQKHALFSSALSTKTCQVKALGSLDLSTLHIGSVSVYRAVLRLESCTLPQLWYSLGRSVLVSW